MGPHGGTVNRLHWMWRAYPFAPGEMLCQKTSLSFVDSIWELFGGLLQGIPTAVLSDTVVKDARSLVDALAARRVQPHRAGPLAAAGAARQRHRPRPRAAVPEILDGERRGLSP